LPTERIERLRYDWPYWARQEQLPPPGEWQKWLFLGGRGVGKTRAGAEAVIQKVQQGVKHIGLVGPTGSDVRDVMVFGPSGIMTIAPPWCRPDQFLHRQRHLVWANGSIATLFSAEELRLLYRKYNKGLSI
jgi:phage terminase large subunit-like protein